MPIIRGLAQLLEDLDRRQRPDAANKNRPIVKFTSVSDTIGLSSDAVVTSLSSGFNWAVAASTSVTLYWGEGEWS